MGLDTLSNVKTRLNITATADDVFLQAQIDLISDVIEAYCRRKLVATTLTQHFFLEEVNPARLIELFGYPVQSVASIVEDGVTLDASNYRLHKPTGRILRIAPAGSQSGAGYFFYHIDETVITYSAGFAAVPRPILSVLDDVVAIRYNKQKSGVDLNFGSDVQRISIPGAISIDFDYKALNNSRGSYFGVILGGNLNVLDQYRSDRAILGSNKISYIDEFSEGNP